MDGFDASEWAAFIRRHENPLVCVGQGCLEIELEGKKLFTYAREVALKLDCPIAATGNVQASLAKTGEKVRSKKMWLAELFCYLQGTWREPLLEKGPDLVILAGYPPWMVRGMVDGVRAVSFVHLGPGRLENASRTIGEAPLLEWKRALDLLVEAL